MAAEIHKSHPAARALEQVLQMTSGGLAPDKICVAACLYDAPLRLTDPGALVDLPWLR